MVFENFLSCIAFSGVNEVLSGEDRMKFDSSSDNLFYSAPKLVYHVDENFRSQLTQLYRQLIPKG